MDNLLSFTHTDVSWIDLGLLFAYLAGITVYGYLFKSRVHTSRDYFLAGKSLPWWIIGMSIIGTNIGSNDYVGGAGGAYRTGMAQANFEWIGAIPAMIIAAFIFIPFYWRAGVFSIPEYLGKRYSEPVRVIAALILSLFSVLIVGVFLWATALMLQTYLGWPILLSILITAGVVGLYTVSGGLAAVAYTDAVQLVIMFAGAVVVAIVGVNAAGGAVNFATQLQERFPDHLHTFLPSTHDEFPWPGVLLGLGLVLSPAYWCTNQAIMQRCLGARTEWDGKASMMFAAMAKTFVPLLIVLPGFFALLMAPEHLGVSDQALPWVVKNLLPPGVSGLLFVAFIAALQSSVSSTLNSASVMVTRDILGVIRSKRLDDAAELRMGRMITIAALAAGILCAPLTAQFRGIYVYVQQLLSFFQGPVFALLLMGILFKRITPRAGLWSLLLGLGFAALLGLAGLNMLYMAFWSFVMSVALLFGISAFTRPKSASELENLTYTSVVKEAVDV